MNKNRHRLAFLCFYCSFYLMGCSGLQVASMATMAVTGKGFSDHALSTLTGQDCAFFNVLESDQICDYENSVEMTLLTNEQDIDDSLKEILPVVEQSNVFLVIASFRHHDSAISYQSEFQQLNTKLLKADQNLSGLYRVVIGPIVHKDTERIKKEVGHLGIKTPWLITI